MYSRCSRGQCRPSKDAILDQMLQVAGDLPRHITMRAIGPRKYMERPNRNCPEPAPVTPAMLRDHLDGKITVGSWLANRDGWRVLVEAGRKLLANGAQPILERSPAKGDHAGGGHLWLVFQDPVDPRAARATGEKHALELRDLPEFCPRAGAVRLLGGYYRRGGTSAWCEAAALRDPDRWLTNWDAAALTWSEDTPSGWVSAAPPPEPEDDRSYTSSSELDTREVACAEWTEPEAWRDAEWLRRYGAGRHSLLWAVLPRHAISWFNSLYDVRTILPKQPNGYALATWRGERTASVAYLPGNRWRDYGACRTQPGGDAFEAYTLVEFGEGGRDRALARVYSEMIGAALRELEHEARSVRGVPAWVAEVMGPAAWARYKRLRAADSDDTQW